MDVLSSVTMLLDRTLVAVTLAITLEAIITLVKVRILIHYIHVLCLNNFDS